MCSIAGFLSKRPLVSATVLWRMMVAGESRGDYSCGAWSPSGYVRKLGGVRELRRARPFWRLFPAKVALGHTRFPTSGGLGPEHAQPFKVKNVVSVHNGHLVAPEYIAKDLRLTFGQDDVDSILWARACAKYGVEDGIAEVADSVGSCNAVSVYHDGKVYAYRGTHGALVWAKLDGLILWASTVEMLWSAFERRVKCQQLVSNAVYEMTLDGPRVVRKLATRRAAWDWEDCGGLLDARAFEYLTPQWQWYKSSDGISYQARRVARATED